MEAIWRCKIKEGWWEERERERERVSHTICLTQSFGLWSGTYGIYFPFIIIIIIIFMFLIFQAKYWMLYFSNHIGTHQMATLNPKI